MIILQKKASWILLILLFMFDSIISYWGVVYMHGRDADLLIAPYVEKYPLLYFLDIPLLIIIMFVLYKIIVVIAAMILKKWKIINKNYIERAILSSMVVYWAVGNSSGNALFLFGYRISDIWLRTTFVAIPVTMIYSIYLLFGITKLNRS